MMRLAVSPVGRLLKFGDVGLHKSAVAEVLVQLTILLDELFHEVDRRNRLSALGEATRESPKSRN